MKNTYPNNAATVIGKKYRVLTPEWKFDILILVSLTSNNDGIKSAT
jgi:hypothetical protein